MNNPKLMPCRALQQHTYSRTSRTTNQARCSRSSRSMPTPRKMIPGSSIVCVYHRRKQRRILFGLSLYSALHKAWPPRSVTMLKNTPTAQQHCNNSCEHRSNNTTPTKGNSTIYFHKEHWQLRHLTWDSMKADLPEIKRPGNMAQRCGETIHKSHFVFYLLFSGA